MANSGIRKHRRSALEAFNGCPYRWDVLYNRCRCGHPLREHNERGCRTNVPATGEPWCECAEFTPIEDRGDESHRGIAFHEAVFRYVARLAEANTAADAGEASLAFREGMALAQCPPALVNEVRRLWVPFVEWFQLDLKAYFAAEERQSSLRCMSCGWSGDDEDVAVEPVLVCPACAEPNLAGFTWIPDLVYVRPHEVEIKDWKTFYKGLTQNQAEREFQARHYLWQARRIWPNFERYRFTFNFVRLRYEVTMVATPDEIDTWTDEIQGILLSMAEAERTTNYPAIAGSHCGLCRLKCPIADNAYLLPKRIGSLTARDAAASRLLVMERELRGLKKAIGSYCQTEGPFVFNGQLFQHKRIETATFPLAPIGDAIREHDPDLTGIAVGNGTARAVLGKLPADTAAKLLLEADAKVTWQFRHQKAGEHPPPGAVDVLSEAEDEGETAADEG